MTYKILEPVGTSTLSLGAHGSLKGIHYANGVRRFTNVPYAQQPTGTLRWKKPVPLPADFVYASGSNDVPLDCTTFGGICPQPPYVIGDKVTNDYRETSEECLKVNIWVPPQEATPPEEGWPVLVFIHGGWLQIGDAAVSDKSQPTELIREGGLNAIVISVGYRLNIFGFLAGEGVDGNFGFWDQRCALEWVQKYIPSFQGNPALVTLGGLSAGAFSTHVQFHYELLHGNPEKPLFKNVWMISNAIPAQPKTIEEANSQLENVYSLHGIDKNLSPEEKLEQLRSIPAQDLVDKIFKQEIHTFRAVTDGSIVATDIMESLASEKFATLFRQRDMKLLIGEAESEEVLYSLTNPPPNLSRSEMLRALNNYYSNSVCEPLLSLYDSQNPPEKSLTPESKAAQTYFGRIVSDVQVRVPIRSFCAALHKNGVPESSVLRYRVAFRPECTDEFFPRSYGVTHSVDCLQWWFVKRLGFTATEEEAVKGWLNRTLIPLVNGKEFQTAESRVGLKEYLYFDTDGKVKVTKDQYWDWLMRVASVIESK